MQLCKDNTHWGNAGKLWGILFEAAFPGAAGVIKEPKIK